MLFLGKFWSISQSELTGANEQKMTFVGETLTKLSKLVIFGMKFTNSNDKFVTNWVFFSNKKRLLWYLCSMKAQHVTDFYPFRNRFSRWASSRIVEQHHTLGQSSFGSRTHCDWAIDKRDSYRGRWVGMISSHFHDRLTCPLASDHSLLSRIPQKLTIKSEQWEANGHAMGLPLEYFVFKRKYGKSDLLGIQNVPLSHSMRSRWFENSKNVSLVFHQFALKKGDIFEGFLNTVEFVSFLKMGIYYDIPSID